VDFFPPVVDDPYLYGQIAAANALSDVFAMGATPAFALNIACFPDDLPAEAIRGILRGGGDKVREAGAVIAGGHTIADPVPKYGLCVTGFIHPEKVWTNAGAKPGDVLILTKPLGSGITATAHKREAITSEQFAPTIAVMAALNRQARDAIAVAGASACTDITGFGLIGHACEMADASGVTIELLADKLPLLPEALPLSQQGIIPGGLCRNREYFGGKAHITGGISPALENILFDPQTSGGLLAAVSQEDALKLGFCIVGRVLARENMSVKVS
jgi:selenide,water dikinase